MGIIGSFGIVQLMIIVVVVYIIINSIFIKKSREFNISREFVKFMFLVYFFGVLAYTAGGFYIDLRPDRMTLSSINFIPMVETIKMFTGENLNNALHQVIGNFIMFIPLGMFLPVLYKGCNKILKIAGISFMCTFIIEFNQWIGGRGADVDDLIINTLGGITGYLIYKLLENIVKKVKLFKVILESSSSEKSAIKGILIVAIPVYLFIHGSYHISNYLDIKYNSVDMSNISSVFEERGREVIATKNIEEDIICMTKDDDGGYYSTHYYKKGEHYFEAMESKINDTSDITNYLYNEEGDFITSDSYSWNESNQIEVINAYIKIPVGKSAVFYNGDKKVSVKASKEISYEDVNVLDLGLNSEEIDKIKVRIE